MNIRDFKTGDVICNWDDHPDKFMGRILEIVCWPEDWSNDGDERPISHFVVEDFPTFGGGISFIFPGPTGYPNLKVINGTGLKPSRHHKVNGEWIRKVG